VPGVKHLPP